MSFRPLGNTVVFFCIAVLSIELLGRERDGTADLPLGRPVARDRLDR